MNRKAKMSPRLMGVLIGLFLVFATYSAVIGWLYFFSTGGFK